MDTGGSLCEEDQGGGFLCGLPPLASLRSIRSYWVASLRLSVVTPYRHAEALKRESLRRPKQCNAAQKDTKQVSGGYVGPVREGGQALSATGRFARSRAAASTFAP